VEPTQPNPLPAAAPPAVRTHLLAALLLAGAILAAYANTLRVPFLLDDTGSIVDNPSIRQLWPPGAVLAPPAQAGFGGRPLANLTFALNYAVHGLDVRGYHVVNLALHAAAALVVFGLLRQTLALPRVTARLPLAPAEGTAVAGGAAAIWALHPLHTEAVTYLSQRTEVLMALCYLLTLYGFVRAGRTPARRWRVVAVGACLLGMAAKEVMVTAPVMVWLYDRTFVAGSFRAAWRARRGLYGALAASWLLLLFLLLEVGERGVGFSVVRWWEYALTESRAVLLYLRLAFWPAPLVFDYGLGVVREPAEVGLHLLGCAALLAATGAAMWRAPLLGFAGAWVLLILAPASSVIPVAGQPIAEHRMYLPLVALAAGVAVTLQYWLGRRAVFATALVALVLGAATFARNRDYRDALTLWRDTIAKRPDNARAHAAFGAALLEARQTAPARAALERALRLDPGLAEAHNNLAAALQELGRTADAIPHFTAALRLRPGRADTHYNFGNALLELGRVSEAIAQQRQALLLRPAFSEAECALAHALAAAGRPEEAIGHFRAALRRQPALAAAHFGLANSLARQGRPAEAVAHYEATLRATPGAVEARYNLGSILLSLGRPTEAIPHFRTAVELKPDFAEAYNNLANALALSGDLAAAMRHYETALRLQPDLAAARQNLEALRRGATPR
jgi:tetratricopeptide (TPR) repeat protein